MNKLLPLALMLGLGHGLSHASPVISFAQGNVFNTPALSSFEATGQRMAGMKVEMCFSNGCTGALTWGQIGTTTQYGVQGSGWSLKLDASTDTFLGDFILDVDSDLALQSFSMYGKDGGTAFDVINLADRPDNQDTATAANKSPGSGNGLPFLLRSTLPTSVQQLDVLYFDQLRVGGEWYGDLYLGMNVSFTTFQGFDGFSGEMLFRADTDLVAGAISPFNPTTPPPTGVPLPGTLLLAGLGLACLGAARRRAA